MSQEVAGLVKKLVQSLRQERRSLNRPGRGVLLA